VRAQLRIAVHRHELGRVARHVLGELTPSEDVLAPCEGLRDVQPIDAAAQNERARWRAELRRAGRRGRRGRYGRAHVRVPMPRTSGVREIVGSALPNLMVPQFVHEERPDAL
jgi:hypothetical protein